jgi:hypothetical protein
VHAQARTRTGAAAKVEGAAATQAVDTAAADTAAVDTAAVTSDQWASAVAASSVAAAAALAATAKPNPKEGNVLFKRKRPAQDAASSARSAGRPRTAPPPAPPAAAAVADAVRPLRAGDRVLARYGAASGEAVALTKWFPGAISVAHEGGACDVAYDDGDFEVVIVSSHSK